MTHDPLCPFAKWDDVDCYQHDAGVRICDLIAKVREDMLAKCIALIEESVPWSTANWIAVDERAAILNALRGLREKP